MRQTAAVASTFGLPRSAGQYAWGARLSETFDLSKEDAADDLLFNEVIWRSVRGPDSPMPAPKRAAFVVPKVKKDDDD